MTPEDFAKLPQIIEASKPVFVGVSDVGKLPVYEMTLTIDGEEYVTRWESRSRRRTLALLTFFIRRVKGA